MIESLRVRWAIIIGAILFAIVWTVPNFVNTEKFWWPTNSRMVLGLDIQGGSHLVLRVDVDSAIRQDATRFANSLPTELKEANTPVKSVTVTDPARGVFRAELTKPEDAAAVRSFIETNYDMTFNVAEATDQAVVFEFAELYVRDFKNRLVEQAIAVIRNRIDEFGVAEPSITAQGTDRILVQLPGIKDAASAKDLINRTARLDFMMVAENMQPVDLQKAIDDVEKEQNLKFGELRYTEYVDKLNAALKGKIPEGTVVYFEKPENAETMAAARIPVLLQTGDIVTGDRLTNAQVSVDQFGAPIVSFTFDAIGAQQFGALTRKHEKKQMAIVLDRVVKSAPVINEPITGGRGQITLGRGRDQQQSANEAKVIATALRAGALPAALEQLEERTVGPTVGADAIRQGQIGTAIAATAVFIFMALYYRSYGIVANLALIFNLSLTLAILSTLGATLTLPGVAGLALTLGMSVDACVIIFERIREEFGKGAAAPIAIREGYDKAFSSIMDANITSILICFVLMYFGTGPIRGFAITLMTGLVITTFTAIFFTRSVLDLLVNKWKWNLSLKWQ